MSNQRPTTMEENFDPTFNYKNYMPPQQQQQTMNFQNLQNNLADMDTQSYQNTISGRFNPATIQQQQETFRNQTVSQGSIPGMDMKQQMVGGYGQLGLNQFSGLQGQSKTIDANLMGRMPQKELNLQTGLNLDPTANQFGNNKNQFEAFSMQNPLLQNNINLQQQQQLQFELLKMQQTPSNQNLFNQNQFQGATNPSLFGVGFLNAAQLLASAQQMQQQQLPPQQMQQQPVPQAMSIQDKSPSQPIGQQAFNNNLNMNMNNIYSNLNHFQNLIDSIEKQGALGNSGQSLPNQQQQQFNGMVQNKTPLAQQTQSYLNATNYQTPTLNNYGYQQEPQAHSSIGFTPNHQSLTKQNNYMDNNLPDINGQSNTGYMNQANLGNENNEPITGKSNSQPFNYEMKSISRERQAAYNPAQYSQYENPSQQQNANNRSFSSDYNYAKTISQAKQTQNQQIVQDNSQSAPISWLSSNTKKVIDDQVDYKHTEHYIQKSPPKKGRENQSPTESLYRNQPNYDNLGDPNESFNYLKFQNQNKQKPSNQNSPRTRQNNSQQQRNYNINYDNVDANNMGANDFMQQSFRNQNHNMSQGSNSILQEQHLNTFPNKNANHNSNNQYSPQSSTYKNDYYDNQQQNSYYIKSNKVTNIDDMPIHAPKAKNFEELLESNLRQMGLDPTLNNDDENEYDRPKPKKEFLKRKSKKPEVTAPVQTKKYNYYVDNFENDKKKENQEQHPVASKAKPSHHNADMERPIGGGKDKKNDQNTRNSHHEAPRRSQQIREQEDNGMTERQTDSNTKDQSKPVKKKTFLARGSGTAGGRKGYDKSNNRQSQEQEQQQQREEGISVKNQNKQKSSQKKMPNPLSDDDQTESYQYDNNKSPRPQNTANSFSNQNNRKNLQQPAQNLQHMTRNSIMEFEKLEKECLDKYSPTPSAYGGANDQFTKKPANSGQQQQPQNKRKKKLFDDSDEEEEEDQEDFKNDSNTNQIDNQLPDNESDRLAQYQSGNDLTPQNANQEAPKSNIVKKFFMKEDSQKPQTSIPRITNSHQSDQNNAVSEEMERIVQQKVEQLNKAMEKFNQEQEQHNKKRMEYEKLIQKAQVEKREFESMKKKAFEEIERLKLDEIEKIKKEKKALEQRSKNLQLVGSSNKKEREEIDALKKELLRVTDESKAKEQKQKMTNDRLKKQVEDLTLRNKELSDELRHHEQQRLQSAANGGVQSNTGTKSQLKQPTNVPASTMNSAQQRYTFSAHGSNQDTQQQQQQQPKGILKNKHESQKNVRVMDSPDQDEDNQYENHEQEEEKYEEEDEIHNIQDNHQQQEDYSQKSNQNQTNQRNQPAVTANNEPQESRQKNQEPTEQYQNQAPATTTQNQQEQEEEEEDYDMKFHPDYHNKQPSNMKVIEQVIGNDGKIQRLYENGKKEVIFNNGVKREVFPDGYTIVYFNNNDIKQTYPDSKVVYHFADARTTQTTFQDGLQVFKFANNQVEKHFPDGTKEIIFPDGTIKCIFADGEEESIFPDGTIQRIEKNGVKAIEFANGQKDILFPDGTRIREFPDGRVRKTYPDGTFENTYRQQ